MKKTVFLKDIKVGDKVDDFFLVAEKNSAFSQKGTPYLNIRLKDKTGEMEAKVWDNIGKIGPDVQEGGLRLCKIPGGILQECRAAFPPRHQTRFHGRDRSPGLFSYHRGGC